jgi:hypothetical protein
MMFCVVAATAVGCGLSDASARACSQGKDELAYVIREMDRMPGGPEIIAAAMVGMARSSGPTFDMLAAQADDDDVRAAFADLSNTLAEFERDVSPKVADVFGDHKLGADMERLAVALNDHWDTLSTACA